MRHSEKHSRKATIENLAGSLMLLSFGLAMLAYLIAIDRSEWFAIRPASGTAAAMSNAAEHHKDEVDATQAATSIAKTGSIAAVYGKESHGTN